MTILGFPAGFFHSFFGVFFFFLCNLVDNVHLHCVVAARKKTGLHSWSLQHIWWSDCLYIEGNWLSGLGYNQAWILTILWSRDPAQIGNPKLQVSSSSLLESPLTDTGRCNACTLVPLLITLWTYFFLFSDCIITLHSIACSSMDYDSLKNVVYEFGVFQVVYYCCFAWNWYEVIRLKQYDPTYRHHFSFHLPFLCYQSPHM